MALNQPSLIPEPWASQGSRTTIPDTTSESGRASWAQGFPPETALPLGSGGVPPHWLDFQGVLHALSNHAVFKQSGGRYAWSASLDYPVGACIIGSNNRVYQALQNSGPGYSAGAKNPTTAGNSAYWGVLATPDGSSIVVNGSGKLAVSATNLADQLADGTTIVASGGKLTAVNQGEASALADGQTIVAANGKLKVNYGAGLDYDSQTGKLIVVFNDLTVEQIAALCDPDGGIAAGANGLYVDFDTMPTDKFEALLKSLKMQIPLSANMNLYVDGVNGSDTLDEGRGKTEALPFKTIQACVNYATQNYAVGAYTIYIRVKSGNYVENVSLPTVTRTSGGMQIRAHDLANPPVIKNATNNGTVLNVSGEGWSLYRLSVTGSRVANDDGLSHYPHLVSISNTGSLVVSGVAFSDEFTGAATSSGYEFPRLFDIPGGSLQFAAATDYATTIHAEMGNANECEIFNMSNGASVLSYSTNNSSLLTDIECWGAFTTFANVSSSATLNLVGGALYVPAFVVPTGKTATGKQYKVSKGGGINLIGSQILPGDVAGTADATTYGWYVGG